MHRLTQKQRTIAAATALGAAAATGTLIVTVTGSSAAAATNAPAAFAPLPATAQDMVGVTLAQHDMLAAPLTTVGQETALAAAATRLGHLADPASSVSVTFGDFTDDQYYNTLPDGTRDYVAKGVPAFVVTYQGATVPLHSPYPNVSNHELSVVVNATTGDVIEVFSYQ